VQPMTENLLPMTYFLQPCPSPKTSLIQDQTKKHFTLSTSYPNEYARRASVLVSPLQIFPKSIKSIFALGFDLTPSFANPNTMLITLDFNSGVILLFTI